MKDTTARKHTDAGLRLLAIHEKLGSANEAELEQALEGATEGATVVVVEAVLVGLGDISYSASGETARIEYASTRTASSVA